MAGPVSATETGPRADAKTVGRLLRISLAPSAAADVAVGLALGAGGVWLPGAAPFLLIGAALCVYHGAMALNDWADRLGDARTRPERPIPSGAVPPRAACAGGFALVAAGIGLAASATPALGAWLAVVAGLAVLYDLRGRGPVLGPLLLALCRFGNFGLGLTAPAWLGVEGAPPLPLVPAALYGTYVFFVSRLGRLEDDEDAGPLGGRPRRYLLAGAACLALVPVLPLAPFFSDAIGNVVWPWHSSLGGEGVALGALAAALVAWAGAFGLARAALTTREWTRGAVGACMGMALRRLLVFTAACALLGLAWGPAPGIVAALALLGYPVSYGLRKVFPPS